MANQLQGPTAVGGPVTPGASTQVPGKNVIPFTRAAGSVRTDVSVKDSPTLTAAQQNLPQVLPGTGFMVWFDLEMVLTATGNASTNTVALAEDAPWAAFAGITLDDGGPQMVNIDGYSLHLLNLYGGYGLHKSELSADASVYSAISVGTGSAAGSGLFRTRIPMAINDRDYWGLLGNQDRATKYNLNDGIAPSTSVFSGAPTVLPLLSINRSYGYLPVPGAMSADGRGQQQIPSTYGIVHYMFATKAAELPIGGGAPINHYLRNLANAVRCIVLVLRSGSGATPRASAEAALPTQIDFKIGTDVIFSESAKERRQIMWDKYRMDAPAGVLVYPFLDDFGPVAGYELGHKYLYLGNVSEAQFAIAYPSGFGSSASNSLTMITDSLYIPPTMDIYSGAL